jgi:hypothetical protein
MDGPFGVIWWDSGAFPRLFSAVRSRNCLLLHHEGGLHVRKKQGKLPIPLCYLIFISTFCFLSFFQQQLYELQKEKESRPQTRYDLTLTPKFDGKSLKRRSAVVVPVKPVEHGGHGEIFETSNAFANGIPRAEKEINRRYQDGKKVTCVVSLQFT